MDTKRLFFDMDTTEILQRDAARNAIRLLK